MPQSLAKASTSIRKLFDTPRLYLMGIATVLQLLAWITGFTRPVPYAAAVCVGLLTAIAGMVLRAGVTIYMERRRAWGLLTNGPFALCRHPRYVGTVMVVAGLMSSTGYSPFGLWLVPLLLTIVPHTRTAREESRQLAEEYPSAYSTYRLSIWNIRGPREELAALTWQFCRRQLMFPVLLILVAACLAVPYCDAIGMSLFAVTQSAHQA